MKPTVNATLLPGPPTMHRPTGFADRSSGMGTKLTRQIRNDYLKHCIDCDKLTVTETTSPEVLSFTNNPTSETLYFWQLYRVLGKDRIRQVILLFYTNVFNDDQAPWFRSVFAEFGDVEYHTARQHLFWMDVFAGGTEYRGGMKGLHFHHKMAKSIMTQSGAQRWMFHMNNALKQVTPEWTILDPRVVPCIEEFLAFTMTVYGVQFDFNVVDWIHDFSAKL